MTNIEQFNSEELQCNQLRSLYGGNVYGTCPDDGHSDLVDWDGCTSFSDGYSACDTNGCE